MGAGNASVIAGGELILIFVPALVLVPSYVWAFGMMTNVVFYSQRLCAAIPWAVKHRGQGIHGTPEAAEELETVLTPAQLARLVSLFFYFRMYEQLV